MQPGYNGQGKIDFFPSTVREHTHSLIYEPNDGRDCHTSAPYRRMTSVMGKGEAWAEIWVSLFLSLATQLNTDTDGDDGLQYYDQFPTRFP